jgi:predicted nucleic acid-binding protein
MIFLDTSAIYALADSRDPNHRAAILQLQEILNHGEELLTHNYVLLESVSLLQARLGLSPAAKFAKESAAFVIEWVDKDLHASGIRELEKSGKRRRSLVDHISFLVMKRRNVTTAFAFDSDFTAKGFQLFEL